MTIVSCSHGSPVCLLPDAAPEVDDLLPVVIRTAGAAQFSAFDEVLDKRLAYRLEARAHVSVDENAFQ